MGERIEFPADLLKNRIRRTLADEKKEGTLKPALIVGLGNTGVQVLLSLKKDICEYYNSLREYRDIFQFLMFDISYPKSSYEGRFDKPDFVHLKVENIRLTVNHLLNIDSNFIRWWETDYHYSEKDLIDGTGGIRQLGRFALKANIIAVKESINSKISIIRKAIDKIGEDDSFDTMNVFVISSACGGTGSGILMDMLILLYRLLFIKQNIKIKIHLFLVLPNAFIDKLYISFRQFRLLHANTFALFKELSPILKGNDKEKNNFELWRHYTETVNELEIGYFKDWSPLESCFIIDNRAYNSKLIPLEMLLSLVSKTLFSMITIPESKMQNDSVLGTVDKLSDRANENIFTLGFLQLYYRSSSMLEYVCSKFLADILKSWISRDHWEQYSGNMINSFQEMLDKLNRKIEEDLIREKNETKLKEQLELCKKDALNKIPKIIPLANAPKIVSYSNECNNYYKMRIEEIFSSIREKNGVIIADIEKKMSGELLAFINNKLEIEGPAVCIDVIEKLWSFLNESLQMLIDRENYLSQKENQYLDLLSETLDKISKKKEINRYTEEFFDILGEYGNYWLERRLIKLKEDCIKQLISQKEIISIYESLQKIENLLKTILNDLRVGLLELENLKEKESSTLFFPEDSFRDSNRLREIYSCIYNEERLSAHKTKISHFAKEFMSIYDIYMNIDGNSAKLLKNILYRYASKVFSSLIKLTAVSGIKDFHDGDIDLKSLLSGTLDEIMPTILLDKPTEELKEILLWGAVESDIESIRELSPDKLINNNFRLTIEKDEIIFMKIFHGFRLSDLETVKLSMDHYDFFINKNEEALKKNQGVRYPVHIEKNWHREKNSLEPLCH